MRFTDFSRSLVVVLPMLVLQNLPVEAQEPGPPGYLVTFSLSEAGCQLSSVVRIENYVKSRQTPDPDDWTVFLEDEAQDIFWQAPVPNPRRLMPMLDRQDTVPFTIKIPDLGAPILRLRDERGEIRLRMALDDTFVDQARANHARFQGLEERNRAAINRWNSLRPGNDPVWSPSEIRPAEQVREPGDWVLEQELPELVESLKSEDSRAGQGKAGAPITPFRRPAGGRAQVDWVISGTVKDEAGAPVEEASILLRSLTSTTPIGTVWLKTTDASGHFSLPVSSNLCPASFILSVGAPGYVRQSAGLRVEGNLTRDFVLETGKAVTGTVINSERVPINRARVRASQGQVFVDSALTESNGTYNFQLPPGTYDFTVLPPGLENAPASQQAVRIDQPQHLDFTLPPASGILWVRVLYPDERSYLLTGSLPKRFEIERQGTRVAVTTGGKGTAEYDKQTGRYFVTYTLFLDPGEYDFTCYPMGHDPVRVSNVRLADRTTVDCPLGSAISWKGVLRGADGTLLPDLAIRSYDDLASAAALVLTDAEGRFTIPLTPDGLVKFSADAGSANILHVERLGHTLTNRTEDCVLERFPSLPDSGGVLTQIYGTSDKINRQNIVIIGDGYTTVREEYTDENGNGQWDGILFYDLDGNGVWNSGEPYQRYGNRTTGPFEDVNPCLQNEPFEDLNHDGMLNLDDQAVFDQNCLDVARAIFGQDVWRNKRHAFNIFRIRMTSNQAGHGVCDRAGNLVVTRDTALGTYVSDPDRGFMFNADSSLVDSFINQHVPEADIRIVLVNQPITMARPTSFIFLNGGHAPDLQNRPTVAHEMGHNPGRLADEYTEYPVNYTGIEMAWANVTTLTDPDLVPWRYLLTPGKEIPSVPGSSGVGLFEGSNYYTGGCYKPTQNCMMVSGNRFCPVCEQAIEVRLARLTGRLPVPKLFGPAGSVPSLRPVFRWEPKVGVSAWMIEIQRADAAEASQVYQVLANSFQLPSGLSPRTLYRWRLKPGAESLWGTWSEWVYFRPRDKQPKGDGLTR